MDRCLEGGDEPRQITIAFHPAEALLRFTQSGDDPTQGHEATPPALYVPGDPADCPLSVLNRVRGPESPMQRTVDAESQDGECFVQAFLDGTGGAGMFAPELRREVFESAVGPIDAVAGPGAVHCGLHPGFLPLRQVLQDVAELVNLTPLHQRPLAEGDTDGLAQPLAAVDHEQAGALDGKTAVDELTQQTCANGLALAAPFGDAQ